MTAQEEAYKKILARAQHELARQAVELGKALAAVDVGGNYIATGYGALCMAYGSDFALKWLRGYLAEIEAAEESGEPFAQTHGHA